LIAVRISPDTVEHVPIGEYSDVNVWNEDVVEAALLLVPEEGVRHPNLFSVSHREVLDLGCKKDNDVIRSFEEKCFSLV